MNLKPLSSEKAVKLIESENTLVFETDKRSNKTELKKEIESVLSVKVSKIASLIRHNKKIIYVTLKKDNPAIDVATKLGMI